MGVSSYLEICLFSRATTYVENVSLGREARNAYYIILQIDLPEEEKYFFPSGSSESPTATSAKGTKIPDGLVCAD